MRTARCILFWNKCVELLYVHNVQTVKRNQSILVMHHRKISVISSLAQNRGENFWTYIIMKNYLKAIYLRMLVHLIASPPLTAIFQGLYHIVHFEERFLWMDELRPVISNMLGLFQHRYHITPLGSSSSLPQRPNQLFVTQSNESKKDYFKKETHDLLVLSKMCKTMMLMQ